MATQKTKRKAEASRGNERIQQLMEEFPEFSRTRVITTDLTREGIRPTEDGRHIGRWALPYAPWYFDYNKEIIYRPEEIAEGYYRTPLFGHFSDGSQWQFMWDSKSPYEVRYEERGRYRLYRDGEPLEEVFFPPRPQWYDRKTSNGTPMPLVVAQRGEHNLCIGALSSCGYGKDACRYCNVNPSEVGRKEMGAQRLTAKQDQDLYETMVAACQENQQRTMIPLSGGVILDPSKEADMYARILKVIRRAEKDAGHKPPIMIMVKAQAMEPQDTMKLKEAGLTMIGFNLEVWDPKLFEFYCPGKAKYVGREKWLERLEGAVEVMGKGQVQSSTMVGPELMPPHGFQTEDEGFDSYLEGSKWLLDHGIICGGADLRCAPGTMFEGMPSPRTEYLLRVRSAVGKLQANYPWARFPR